MPGCSTESELNRRNFKHITGKEDKRQEEDDLQGTSVCFKHIYRVLPTRRCCGSLFLLKNSIVKTLWRAELVGSSRELFADFKARVSPSLCEPQRREGHGTLSKCPWKRQTSPGRGRKQNVEGHGYLPFSRKVGNEKLAFLFFTFETWIYKDLQWFALQLTLPPSHLSSLNSWSRWGGGGGRNKER